MAVTLGVVVVNYASCDLLVTNLLRVMRELRTSPPPGIGRVHTVVVDNFTSADERERVRVFGEKNDFHVLPLADNLGFGSGVNRGADQAFSSGADVLLLINPDAWVDAVSVGRLVDRVLSHPGDLAAPVTYRPDGSLWSAGMDVHLSSGQLRATRYRPPEVQAADVEEWVSGACLVAGRQLWQEIGGFDEDYFMYWEDVDLGHRVGLVGGRSVVVPDATAVHDESGTQRSPGGRSPLFYYYNTRNRLLFAAKHLSPVQQHQWRRHSRANILRMLRPVGVAVLRPPWRSALAVVSGERDGRRGVRGRSRHG